MVPVTALSLDRYPVLLRHAQLLDLQFAVDSSGARRMVTVRRGDVSLSAASLGAQGEFTIAAAAGAWAEFARHEPRPGYQDVIAMIECGHARITGNVLPFFQNLLLVKTLVGGMFRKQAA